MGPNPILQGLTQPLDSSIYLRTVKRCADVFNPPLLYEGSKLSGNKLWAVICIDGVQQTPPCEQRGGEVCNDACCDGPYSYHLRLL